MKIRRFNEYFDNDVLKAQHEIQLLKGELDYKELAKNIHKGSISDNIIKMIFIRFPIFQKFKIFELNTIANTAAFIYDKNITTDEHELINIHLDLRIGYIGILKDIKMYHVYMNNVIKSNDKIIHEKEQFIETPITRDDLFTFIIDKAYTDFKYIELFPLKKYNIKLFDDKPLKDAIISPQVN